MSASEAEEGPIGGYALLERIARGGMAEVWRARGKDGAIVCIKRLDPSLKSDIDFVEMFRDEASLVLDFDHENIVKVYELIDDGEELAMVMELVEGPSLAKVRSALEQQKDPNATVFGVDEALQIAIYLCRALHHAHTRTRHGEPLHIVHRDVSPQNVLLSNDGVVKLLDFGIAKATQRLTRTRAGALKGKCSYMAPEQVRGERIDHRADQFATGILLWEMLTGRRLFSGRNEVLILEQVARSDAVPPSTVRKTYGAVPKDVDHTVLRALGWAPQERFLDMLAFEQALQGCLDAMVAEEAPGGVAKDSVVDLTSLVARSARVATATATESGALRTRVIANASTLEKEDSATRPRERSDRRAVEAPVMTDPFAQPEHTGQFFEQRRRNRMGLWFAGAGVLTVAAAVGAAVLFAERDPVVVTPVVSAPTPPLVSSLDDARALLRKLSEHTASCTDPCLEPLRAEGSALESLVDVVRFDQCLARCGAPNANRFAPPSPEALEATLRALPGHPCRTELLEDTLDAQAMSVLGRAALADAVNKCAVEAIVPASEREKHNLNAPAWPKKKQRTGAVARARAADLVKRGRLALADGEYERAKVLLVEAVDLEPWRVDQHERIGTALRGLGDAVGAGHHFRLYFHAHPLDADRERIALYLKRYHQPIELGPPSAANPSPEERYARVQALLEKARAQSAADAITSLRDARTLLPSSVDVLERLSAAYLEAGRKDEAKEALEAALKVKPSKKLKEQLRSLGS